MKAGYRVLFHGPPGTGKTLTASLLGKYTNKPVYRIDLSTVVSKYIGETEKNLSNLFNKAQHKDWILFFDEADAIFGKRTNVRDAHDKYANQEVSYLLQRVEAHPGLIILALNFRDNIDESFTRRFQSIIKFEMPGATEREAIWKTNLPEKLKISEAIDWEDISKKYELTGSNILNIIQFCSLKVLNGKSKTLTPEILQQGIRREFVKENRTH
ncbi:ATP-binding protein [Aequorivita viscosa]|nr:ATP-binding protein [Aequorivita viscosa]